MILKIQEKRTNKLINTIGIFIIVSSVGIIGYSVFNKFDNATKITKSLEVEKSEKNKKSEKKVEVEKN